MRNFYLFLIAILFTFTGTATAQLTGMSPNVGSLGQTLTTTITGNGIFIQAGSPSGNIYSIKLKQGAYEIVMFDLSWWGGWGTTYVVDPNTVISDLQIPSSAPSGLYDLDVVTGDIWNPNWNQQLYVLPGAFTVAPPDGYISGKAYMDLDEDGVFDTGEPAIVSQGITLNPGNIYVTTDGSGNYSYPAMNGSYTVSTAPNYYDYMFLTSPASIPITIASSNSTGNNFGFTRTLISITPDSGYSAMSSMHQIVADRPIFTPGPNAYGNVSYIYLMTSPSVYVPQSQITVIDSFTVQFTANIGGSVLPQVNRDVRVTLYGAYAGNHNLKQVFDVKAPPAFVSGKVFFDQNLNKLYDTGEPGIRYAKVLIAPDSSYGFTNYYGDYTIGSNLGPQTLTFINTYSDLVLFTDSASYTFNAAGNITGKNFGLISTNPDYSIDLRYAYIFPRCNSQQSIYFVIRNISNTYYTAQAWIQKDPLMTYVSSNYTPSMQGGNFTYWTFPNMAPYTEITVLATYMLPGAGTSITFETGAASLDAGGITQLIDTVTRHYNIICAIDPNDKQVTPPGVLPEHFTLFGDTLDYLIRFQNCGTDTAFNVIIKDTLDSDLLFSSFEIINTSHSMKAELEKDGRVVFKFNNILLPDSNVNEAASHGFINYRIRSRGDLPDSTLVNNTAYIYFDFNDAVVTNTTWNTLVEQIPGQGPLPVELGYFDAIPQKENILLKWMTYSEVNNNFFTIEKSKDGISYEEIGRVEGSGTTSNTTNYLFPDNHPWEGLQYYRLRQTDYDGTSKVSDAVVVRWGADADIFIFPNPSSGQLYLNITSDVDDQTGKLMISDISGKTVLVKDIYIEENSSVISLLSPDDALAAGSYFVSVVLKEKSLHQHLIIK